MIHAATLLLAALQTPPTTVQTQPTIVVVMTDDQGWGDIGLRDDALHTPELDALFEEGVELRRFYAAAPVCSPTRASVLTGRHPARMGIDGANDGHLPRAETTLAEVLGPLGYRTGFFGKWHLGTLTRDVKDSNRGGRPKHAPHYSPPWEHGFDVSFATEAKVPTYDPMKKPGSEEPYGTRYWTGPEEAVDAATLGGDDSALIVRRAIAFLEQAREAQRPALVVVWLHAPHEPVVRHHEQLEALGLDAEDRRDRYVACLADVDAQVGALKRALLAETERPSVLMYCSDNGPEHRDGPGTTAGLRGRKRDLLEGGIRVPGAIWWSRGVPESVDAEALRDRPACTVDIFPTARALAGVLDNGAARDGRDMLADAPKPYGFRSKKQRAWIDGRWKVHSKDEGKTWALYDLEADPFESRDVAVENKTRHGSLCAAFELWEADVMKDREDAPEASR